MNTHLQTGATTKKDGRPSIDMSFEEFFEVTYRRVFTALCLVTGDRHEAEEITQDAFLKVFERWDRVEGLEDPEGYLFRTAMNVFRSRYRRAALAARRTLALAPTAIDGLAAVEARHEVIRLLRGLAPRERAAIVLTAILDLPAEEAGRMLGIEASTVRALAARARSHIKDDAEDRR
jgi:RNA polymerase sigma-70 factor (ECF subfamily)